MPKMTKAMVVTMFKTEILPGVRARYERNGVMDCPARSEAWNDFTDGLAKDRVITQRQYDRWTAPACVSSRRRKR